MIITHFFHNIFNTGSYLFYYFYEKGGRERGGRERERGEGEREIERDE